MTPPPPPPLTVFSQIRQTGLGRSSQRVVIMPSFMQGSCQRLAMAKIDIGGQVRLAAHGCKWPCSFYNLDTLQYYTNLNMFLEFFYLLRCLRSDLRKFWSRGVRKNNNNNNIKKRKTNPTPKNEKFGKFAETRPKKI